MAVKTKDRGIQTKLKEIKLDVKEMIGLQKFIFYCCEKCEYKSREGTEFKTHLDDNHNEVKDEDDHDDIAQEDIPDDISEKDEEPKDIGEFFAKFEVPECNAKSISCLKCDLIMDSLNELFDHLNMNHISNESELDFFECKEFFESSCEFTCMNIASFKLHLAEHTGVAKVEADVIVKEPPVEEKPKKIKKTRNIKKPKPMMKCLKCGQDVPDFIDHVQTCLDPNEEIICLDILDDLNDTCDFTTKSFEDFKTHFESKHLKKKPPSIVAKKKKWSKMWDDLEISCLKCDLVLPTSKDMLAHFEEKHSEETHDFYACCKFTNMKICPFLTSTLAELANHIEDTHYVLKKKSFKKIKLDLYKNIEYMCKLCDSTFQVLNGMCSHLRYKHSDHQGGFKCSDFCRFKEKEDSDMANGCEKIYLEPKDLIDHIMEHQDQSQSNIKFRWVVITISKTFLRFRYW